MFSLSSELEAFQARAKVLTREKIAPPSGPTRFLKRAILVEEIAYASAAVFMIPMVN